MIAFKNKWAFLKKYFFTLDVPKEVFETEIDISNKTQGNSGEESPKDNVEQHPVIKSNQQKESLDVAQDRSDIISERMQEIIVGGAGGEMENFEGKNPNRVLLVSIWSSLDSDEFQW